MSDRLRFGLIGSGSQGRYLGEALLCAGVGELVACADPNEAAREKAKVQFGLEAAWADGRDMLAACDLDAVIVATVHDQLQPMALAAVEAGRHVFVEKPMALTALDGQVLDRAAAAKGVRLMVGYALRFKPDRVLMRQLVDDGAIGEIVHITAGQLIGKVGGWLSRRQHGGGPLLYVGSHALDQVLWLNPSPVERVFAEVNPAADGDVEADALFSIRFADGCVAQVACSQKLGGRYGWLDLLGTHGRIRTEWESHRLSIESRKVEAYRHLTHIEVPFTGYYPPLAPDATSTLASYYYVRMWAAEMVEFGAAIRAGRDPSVSGADGVRALQVMDAVFESGKTGRPVCL